MKAILTTLLVLILASSCRKSGGTGTGTGTPASTQDNDNYVIIDGTTYYHHSWGVITTTCNQNLFAWTNNDQTKPNYGGTVLINNTNFGTFQIKALINGVLLTYSNFLNKPFQTNIVSGKTTIEFKDYKLYEGLLGVPKDTLGPYKLISGKVTCNGK